MLFDISKHALAQMKLRGIEENTLQEVLKKPGEIITYIDKKVYQSIVDIEDRQYLIRVFVNHIKEPNMVITVYKTSKISKYYEGNL